MVSIIFRFLLSAAGVLLGPSIVLAQSIERLEFVRGNFGEDAEFLVTFIAERWAGLLSEDYDPQEDLTVARLDLNDDGTEEIILQLQARGSCGSAGCNTYVFLRRGERWEEIGAGEHSGLVFSERVCGYRSLISRDGVSRWTGTDYAFAYCFPRENQCRSHAIEYDEPTRPLLERLTPSNALIASQDCADPARRAASSQRVLSTGEVLELFQQIGTRSLTSGHVFDLLPGNYGSDAAFIGTVVAETFEPTPLPDNYSRNRNIHIGRIDLNVDGMEELFIANYHYDACEIDTFVDGCPFLLFQREGTGWREIGKGRLRYTVFLLDETIEGYRSIRGQNENYRWTGERYEAVPW